MVAGKGESESATPAVCMRSEVSMFQKKSEKDFTLIWTSLAEEYQDHGFRCLSKFGDERGRNVLAVSILNVESQGKANRAAWVKIKMKSNDIT